VSTQENPLNQPGPVPHSKVEDSNSLDLGKESEILPSSHPSISWVDEVDEAEVVKNTKPSNQQNMRMEGLKMSPPSVKHR